MSMAPKILPLDKLLKSQDRGREYWKAEYSGKNESGFSPVGDRVLVLPDQAADVTAGGVMLTPELIERHTLASETGIVIELGEGAFRFCADGSKWSGYKPSPGDHVYMQRYAGQVMYGRDEKFYRLMDSACIAAVKAKSE